MKTDSIIAELKAEIRKLEQAVAALERLANSRSSRTTNSGSTTRPRRKLSAAGRARIAAAQKARWAKLRAGKK